MGAAGRIASEKQHTLEHLLGEKDKFEYVYDFGDNWVHQIVVEKVMADGLPAPRCIAGARGCPPEDCGGSWGYAELVAALLDEKHPRHEELSEWVQEDWSPERFDLENADKLVAKHQPQPGRPRVSKSRTSRAGA